MSTKRYKAKEVSGSATLAEPVFSVPLIIGILTVVENDQGILVKALRGRLWDSLEIRTMG